MTDLSGDLHTRVVALAKVLLPLAALALLSTMFLFARTTDPSTAVPLSDIEAIARDPRVSQPYFAGIADDGSVVAISADEIRPDPDQPDAFAVNRIAADIDATDGSTVRITAGKGRIDPRARTATMTGLARLTSSSGYEMETGGLIADFGTGVVTSIGPLEIQAPFGDMTAGGMRLAMSGDGTGQQMVFNGGVRLLYQRQTEGSPQ